ncbi:MAG TPA: hypothetical protein VK638_51515, partial [Edaphobacter sp.]|nr:hypothetical protein [Edaphobacter sp.]
EKNGHFLWIPAVTHGATTEFPHWLQELTLPLLQDFLVLASMSTNLMTYFNSIHAGASVNHIHFQSVYREKQAAIDKAATLMNRHRYFLKDYPASGLVYMEDTPAETIWHDIGKLQEHGIPFNLIHTGCRIYLVPRNIAYETVAEFPNGVLAAMEISGKAITTEQSFYLEADSAQFQIALRKSTLTIEELLPFLES